MYAWFGTTNIEGHEVKGQGHDIKTRAVTS